jgi:hypothetical protein
LRLPAKDLHGYKPVSSSPGFPVKIDDVDEPVGLGERGGAKNCLVDDAEYGGRSADSQSEDENQQHRLRWFEAEAPKSKMDIPEHQSPSHSGSTVNRASAGA